MSEPATKVEIPPMDWGMAAINGLMATLVVLQRNGALQISDVATEVGNSIDFRRRHKTEAPEHHTALALMYEMILVTERNEAQLSEAKAKRDGASGIG